MVTVVEGDVRAMLETLPGESVQCVVTSPPYWGLRDYGVEGQIGLEGTPEEYIAAMVDVFREVRRVLRGDGTCWVNLGDSFDGKDLVGMPWRVALALQADGWFLRADIIWAKPNPMPESVTDRPTKAHEYVFLLTKGPRYYYDAEAVREASTRNLRSVWTIPSEPFPEAHFATFPRALADRCILAGTSAKGCCAACGAPWVRETEREVHATGGGRAHIAGGDRTIGVGWEGVRRASLTVATTGWAPTCGCDAGAPVPCTVLDPFGGSGTVGVCAEALGRHSILIELSPAYAAMARRRTAQRGLFTQGGV